MTYPTFKFDRGEYSVFNLGQELCEYFEVAEAVAKLRTPDDVRARLAQIDAPESEDNPRGCRYTDRYGDVRWSCDGTHQQSDYLQRDLLRAISLGIATEPTEMARLALTTEGWDFSRWYA